MRDLQDIRLGLESEFGLSPSDDSLDAMLALIEQPRPELFIWAYAGVKRHSWYFRANDLTCSRYEFDSLLDRAGLELVQDFQLQIKGWLTLDDFSDECFGRVGDSCGWGDYAQGLQLDIPDCCARTYWEGLVEKTRTFYADHPIEGYTSPHEWFDAKRAESREDFSRKLFERVRDHELEFDGERYNPNFENYARFEAMIQDGELPSCLHLLLGHTFLPCTLECEAYRGQAECMYRSLAIFLGEERADAVVDEYEHKQGCR